MCKKTFILLSLVVLLIASCKKEVTREDLTYKCECGDYTLDGTNHLLTDAHWVTLSTDTDDFGFEIITGKDYYTTAKIDLEDETEAHHLNVRITIPILTEGVTIGLDQTRFFEAHPDSNSVDIFIEEINFNTLTTSLQYIVTAGAFEFLEDAQSGTDNIEFQLEVAPSLDGFTPIGFPIPFTGSLSADKEEI